MAFATLLVLLPFVLTPGVLSTPTHRAAMTVHESVASLPASFVASGAASPSEQITLRVALAQTNISGLASVVQSVSDPKSPSYGQYLTPSEVAEYVKPAPSAAAAVSSWFASHNITLNPLTAAGDILQFALPVQAADALFDTKFSKFTHKASGVQYIRAFNYSIPADLKDYILYAHPIVAFTPPVTKNGYNSFLGQRAPEKSKRQLAPCEDIVTPDCIQGYYGLPSVAISGSTTNAIGVAGYNSAGSLPEYGNFADMATFLQQFRPDLVGNMFSVELLNGAVNLQDNSGGGEAPIDLQYTVGVAGDVPVTYVLDENDTGDAATAYQDHINWLLAHNSPPTVFTTSYGSNEADLTQSVATSLCNGYMQVAALGVSMIFSSGDDGAGISCSTEFVPMFPPTCPYVTAVGGTFGEPPAAFGPSGGGFSNYFTALSYQTTDTAAYVASIGTEYSGMYNPAGRGYPDVAASFIVYIVNDGNITSESGTSCSAPIFASFIALVNDRLIAAGKPVLGFLNPVLYGSGRGGLDDVTTGGSEGCSGLSGGWSATTGWDPVSGLGTPDFDAMMTALGI